MNRFRANCNGIYHLTDIALMANLTSRSHPRQVLVGTVDKYNPPTPRRELEFLHVEMKSASSFGEPKELIGSPKKLSFDSYFFYVKKSSPGCITETVMKLQPVDLAGSASS